MVKIILIKKLTKFFVQSFMNKLKQKFPRVEDKLIELTLNTYENSFEILTTLNNYCYFEVSDFDSETNSENKQKIHNFQSITNTE
jgi:hypothetical protein